MLIKTVRATTIRAPSQSEKLHISIEFDDDSIREYTERDRVVTFEDKVMNPLDVRAGCCLKIEENL